MNDELRLMCVLAHPDDESMGTGGILARYAAEGIATYLVCATRGERGWLGDSDAYPGPEALGRLREAELHAAAEVLGIRRIDVLDYIDGDLDRADPVEAISTIAQLLRENRPHVVVTFAADGAYGHPDHIAINQFTAAACVLAADAGFDPSSWTAPHRVSKLYYFVIGADLAAADKETVGEIGMDIDGVRRLPVVWPEWAITTNVDCTDHWRTVKLAVWCHRSQLPGEFDRLSDDLHRRIWGCQQFYRAYSLVNGGRAVEDDLFAGLR